MFAMSSSARTGSNRVARIRLVKAEEVSLMFGA